jgi:hypothetical protein
MLPCPIWFWYRWASGIYLGAVFTWSIYNGATFYIDHYGKKFQKELEALKKDVAKWQNSPEGAGLGPVTPGEAERTNGDVEKIKPLEGSTGVLAGAAEGETRVRK